MPPDPVAGQSDWWKHAVIDQIYPRSNANQPELHAALRRLRSKVIDRHRGRVPAGETWTEGAEELNAFTGHGTTKSSCRCSTIS